MMVSGLRQHLAEEGWKRVNGPQHLPGHLPLEVISCRVEQGTHGEASHSALLAPFKVDIPMMDRPLFQPKAAQTPSLSPASRTGDPQGSYLPIEPFTSGPGSGPGKQEKTKMGLSTGHRQPPSHCHYRLQRLHGTLHRYTVFVQ